MKNKKQLLFFAIVISAISLSVGFYLIPQLVNRTGKKINTENKPDGNKIIDSEKADANPGSDKKIRLSQEDIKEFDLEVATAGPGKIRDHINLPGEIVFNADRLAHVTPRVSGIAREIKKVLGDRVRKGEVMAVLESRELADAKAAFLSARERNILAQSNFRREEKLWKEKISSEQEYLEAKNILAESRIELRSVKQKLHALGFSEKFLKKLPTQSDLSFTRYQMIAPFDGTVTEKHISLGEALSSDVRAFVIADLSSVWVNINVYQKDLPFIREGLPVVISASHGMPDTRGTISYVGPMVGEKTRTVLARVVLSNPEGYLRPGMFITAGIAVGGVEAPIVIPKAAIQDIDGTSTIFVEEEGGFLPKSVTVGRTDLEYAEITSGLSAGQQYIARGAFTLKAQLSKGAAGGDHGH